MGLSIRTAPDAVPSRVQHPYTYIHTYIYIYIYIYIYVRTHTHIYIYIYVCVYISTVIRHVYIYIYDYILLFYVIFTGFVGVCKDHFRTLQVLCARCGHFAFTSLSLRGGERGAFTVTDAGSCFQSLFQPTTTRAGFKSISR